MASLGVDRPARTKPAHLARELEVRDRLPYARHLTDRIIRLDNGALLMSFRLDGASFETADVRDLNDWHGKLNGAWRNLASDRLAVWHHLVRYRQDAYPDGRFRSAFAQELDAAYRARISREQMYVNALYVSLVLHPGRDVTDRAQALANRLSRRFGSQSQQVAETEADAIKTMQDAGRDLAQYLARYGATALGLIERDGLWFSEPMALLRLVLTGRPEPVPLVRGHLGSALYTSRIIFGREALEIRDAADARFAGLFGVKEYPATTRPGLWDTLLSARFSFVCSQSFTFLSKAAARAVMERKQNQMTSAQDRATSQIAGLDDALDDLMSNRFVMGDHQASLMVLGDSPRQLADHMSKARALLADSGLVVAREDLAIEAAFWAQFPGNFKLRARPRRSTAATSRPWPPSTHILRARLTATIGVRPWRSCARRRARRSSSISTSATSATPSFAAQPARGRRWCRTSCWPSSRSWARSRCSSTRIAAPRSLSAPAVAHTWRSRAVFRRGLRRSRRSTMARPRTGRFSQPSCANLRHQPAERSRRRKSAPSTTPSSRLVRWRLSDAHYLP